MKRWFLRGALALVAALVLIGILRAEEINRLLAVNSLFREDRIIANFAGMDELFEHTILPAGDAATPLPTGPAYTPPPDVTAWIAERDVTALVILKDGELVYEIYPHGDASDTRIAWSVSKSFLSALIGILIEEGTIGSVDDPVTDYVPELADTAYADARIEDVLQMSSGVVFDEDYLDFNSDINRMGRVLALGGSMDEFAMALTETDAAPGERWRYVSIDTHILGMVARAASGRSLADLMTEKIIQPLGLEQDPIYLTDGNGVAFALGGLNLTTRDFARFGQMIAQGGEWQGKQIVPRDWIDRATRPSARSSAGQTGYGYQWWTPPNNREGEFMARGVYGQYIYIDRQSRTVIAVNAADRNFRQPGVTDRNVAIFRGIRDDLEE